MKDPYEVKAALYRACTEDVAKRIRTIREILTAIDASRSSETKSSAGDKFETGRAMLHLEEQNNQRQLAQVLQLQQDLDRIDSSRRSTRVEGGSLVITNRGNYYLSVGLGKVTLGQDLYYCISLQSPIGANLVHKVVGDRVHFNGNAFQVEQIY